MSRNVIAPSRGTTTTPQPQRALHLRRCDYCRAGTVLGRRAPRRTVPRPPGWLLTTPCAPPWLPAPKLGPAPTPATPPGTPPSLADAAAFSSKQPWVTLPPGARAVPEFYELDA